MKSWKAGIEYPPLNKLSKLQKEIYTQLNHLFFISNLEDLKNAKYDHTTTTLR